MADNTPSSLDSKPEAPPPAPAPTEPTPAAPAKAGVWAGLTGKQKLLAVAGGSVLAVVGGMYGAKQFTASPPRALAQTPAVVAQEPERTPDPAPTPPVKDETFDPPPVVAPPIRTAGHQEKPAPPDLDKFLLPPIEVPRELPADVKTEKGPDKGLPDLNLPPLPGAEKDPARDGVKPGGPEFTIPIVPVKPLDDKRPRPAVPDYTAPKLPPLPDTPGLPEVTIPTGGAKLPPSPGATEDPFKAPDTLPPLSAPPKARPTGVVVPAGGADTPVPPLPAVKLDEPAKKPDPTKIDLDIPPPPPLPVPLKPDPIAPLPPIPALDDKLPTIPAPGVGTTPLLPEVKTPGVKVPDPGPPPIPMIEVRPTPMPTPPAVAAPPAAKKDAYDEDWHTPEGGQTFEWISSFYYKTADYAKALKAYNRDRQKPGETIVRVPPVWVLEEKFPDLAGKDPKPAVGTPTGLKFDPVEPAGGSRPAPPPAVGTIGSSDEYRVTTEAGEKIKDIARKVYGDPLAWKKLMDMNPGLDPTEPIPAGTTLRVGK